MKNREQKLKEFLLFFKKHIQGSERGEGQIFFEKLLLAFGNAGIREAGAICEERVEKKKGRKGFIDFVWEPRVMIELKKRGEPLQKHYDQALDYWLHRIPRLQYMILCNFDKFWIYDLNQQPLDPVHKLNIEDLPNNWGPLAFLFPDPEKPTFQNHNIAVTEGVARKIGNLYHSLLKKDAHKEKAQRFVLQMVVALFSEDVDLIPKYTVHNILSEAVRNPIHQKKLKELFLSMAGNDKPSNYKQIPFFNGGLFEKVETLELFPSRNPLAL